MSLQTYWQRKAEINHVKVHWLIYMYGDQHQNVVLSAGGMMACELAPTDVFNQWNAKPKQKVNCNSCRYRRLEFIKNVGWERYHTGHAPHIMPFPDLTSS